MKKDAIVIGAGPVGLALALELARYGLKVRIIDKKEGPSTRSKALGIMPRTVELLEKPAVSEAITNAGKSLQGIRMYDGIRELLSVKLPGFTGSKYSIFILPQYHTEHLLIERLKKEGVEVEWETCLTDLHQDRESVRVTIKHSRGREEIAEFPWLLACDGVKSTTRELLNIEFDIEKAERPFLLVDLDVIWDIPHHDTATFFSPQGDMAVFPFTKKPLCRIVGPLYDHKNIKEEEIDLDFIRSFFQERCKLKASLEHPRWISLFKVQSAIIKNYRHNRIFFAGDSAHVHSPQGGQGMNTGIQDAFNIAWKLALVHRGIANNRLLDTYQLERHPVARKIVRNTGGTTFITLFKNPVLRKIRNFFVVLAFRWFKQTIFQAIANTSISYKKNEFVKDALSWKYRLKLFSSSLRAGQRAPDVEWTDHERQDYRLFDLFRSQKFILLYFSCNQKVNHFSAFANYSEEMEIIVISKTEKHLQEYGPRLISDPKGEVFNTYQIREDTICLIRPDGYISWFNKPADLEKTRRYLDFLLTKNKQPETFEKLPVEV